MLFRKLLIIKARTQHKLLKENYLGNHNTKIQLAENIEIDLQKTKAKDFYWLLNEKVNNSFPTGPKNWSNMNLNPTEWRQIFKLAKQICRENKSREFHYKFLGHRIIVTKKELCRFGIKQDSDCLYCGKEDSIEHTFINCQFSKASSKELFNGSITKITLTNIRL